MLNEIVSTSNQHHHHRIPPFLVQTSQTIIWQRRWNYLKSFVKTEEKSFVNFYFVIIFTVWLSDLFCDKKVKTKKLNFIWYFYTKTCAINIHHMGLKLSLFEVYISKLNSQEINSRTWCKKEIFRHFSKKNANWKRWGKSLVLKANSIHS